MIDKDKQPTFGDGKICYIEIPSFDPRVSADFYHNCFGWRIRDRGDGELSFDDSVIEVSGVFVTGRKPSTDPGFIWHIMVRDINKSIDSVIAFGGKILQSPGADAPEKTATFADPAGNIVGLYQHNGPM